MKNIYISDNMYTPYEKVLYNCSLCNNCTVTHKRNNVEQHIWQHHGDHHRGQNGVQKYRANEHKHLVAPFLQVYDPSNGRGHSVTELRRSTSSKSAHNNDRVVPHPHRQSSYELQCQSTLTNNNSDYYACRNMDSLESLAVCNNTSTRMSFSGTGHRQSSCESSAGESVECFIQGLSSGARQFFASDADAIQRAMADAHFERCCSVNSAQKYYKYCHHGSLSAAVSPVMQVPSPTMDAHYYDDEHHRTVMSVPLACSRQQYDIQYLLHDEVPRSHSIPVHEAPIWRPF